MDENKDFKVTVEDASETKIIGQKPKIDVLEEEKAKKLNKGGK